MNLLLERLTSDNDSTIGNLFADYKFQCVTCEDEFRATKVPKETRIPAGRYEIGLRTVGGHHADYLKKFGADWHKGMLQLLNVPGFEAILIHIGNTEKDTEGCILVGMNAIYNGHGGGSIASSTEAYKRLYPQLRDALLRKERVFITIIDKDHHP